LIDKARRVPDRLSGTCLSCVTAMSSRLGSSSNNISNAYMRQFITSTWIYWLHCFDIWNIWWLTALPVVFIIFSIPHRHSAWQRTKRRQVGGDTGMIQMGWVTAGYGDAGVTEMGYVTGSIYWGDPGIDRSHLISFCQTTSYILYLSDRFSSLVQSEISWIFTARDYHIFSPSYYTPWVRTALPHELRLECCASSSSIRMVGSRPASSAVSTYQLLLWNPALRGARHGYHDSVWYGFCFVHLRVS